MIRPLPSAPICLLQMPYGAVERPSLGLSLLQAVLRGGGLEAAVVPANLGFAERVGLGRYRLIDATPPEELVGEWTFAEAAFRHETPRDATWYERLSLDITHYVDVSRARVIEEIEGLRAAAGAFVDEMVEAIVAARPRIVGCTSVFQQHCASLAVLRGVRERAPGIVTVMGGANCDGEMGAVTHRCFPWVDFVVSGEAEEIAVPLFRAILEHGCDVPAAALRPGVFAPAHRASPPAAPWRATVWNLGAVPQPSFDDWFGALDGGHLAMRVQPGLPLETSRGCWWGQKHHCTFCGLNGGAMKYRSKPPDVVLAELEALAERHGMDRFIIVDNILDTAYFESLLPALAARGGRWRLFFETKSNLRREQVAALAAAGVDWILPGIESLHDEVLKLMDKGSTAMGNVQLLKWLREHGVRASWNFLVGLPGERDAWYAEMAAWMPLVEHLQPPGQAVTVRYDRFSPYQMRPSSYGIEMRPSRNYAAVYPVSEGDIADLAFYFEDAEGTVPPGRSEAGRDGLRAVRDGLRRWNERFWQPLPPMLSMRDDGNVLQILDTRACALARRVVLRGSTRRVYAACAVAASRRALQAALPDLSWAEVEETLGRLVEQRLVLSLDGRWLALALAGDVPALPRYYDFPGGFPDMSTTGARVARQPSRKGQRS